MGRHRTVPVGGSQELRDGPDRPGPFGVDLNAFKLIVFFSLIPVGLGLLVASVMSRVSGRRFGTVVRTVLFLPQVIPLVAAGIAWKWAFSTLAS